MTHDDSRLEASSRLRAAADAADPVPVLSDTLTPDESAALDRVFRDGMVADAFDRWARDEDGAGR